MERSQVIIDTKVWLQRFVVGLNICPFAKRPFEEERIKYVVIHESDLMVILSRIEKELVALELATIEEAETTLIVLPDVDLDFEGFNDFNGIINDLISYMAIESVLQAIVFHPDFRFEDATHGDIANSTNRSPYPMIHLLRQESIASLGSDLDGQKIAERNLRFLTTLGVEGLKRRLNNEV